MEDLFSHTESQSDVYFADSDWAKVQKNWYKEFKKNENN